MKFLKWLFFLVGLVGLIVAGFLLFKNYIDIRQLHGIAYANKSAEGPNPNRDVMVTVGIAAASGLLAGVGIALPRRLRPKTVEVPVDRVSGERLDPAEVAKPPVEQA
ncbi:MAG TPA: hypothetical protein PKN27_10480 [Propionibacteriaceae bacterium]|nr:hypothetical protein [Propionibacteriaceae bacterium]